MAEEDLRVNVNLDTTQFEAGVHAMRRGFSGFSDELTRSMTRVRRSITDVNQVLTRMDLAQVTVQQSAERVSTAQARYNEAILKFGANSAEAEKAAKELAKANDELVRAQDRAKLSNAIALAQIAQMASRIPAAVTSLRALAAANLSAATASAMLANVVTLGAAAIGIIAGWQMIQGALSGVGAVAIDSTGKVEGLRAAVASGATEYAKDWATRMAASQRAAEVERQIRDAIASGDREFFAQRKIAYENDIAAKKKALEDGLASIAGLESQIQGAFSTPPNDSEDARQRRIEFASRLIQLRDQIFSPQKAQELVAAIDADTAALARLEAGGQEAAKIIESGFTSAAEAARSSMSGAIQGIGVDLKAMSEQALASLSAMSGPLGELSRQALAAKVSESALTTEALRSSKALRDQAEITAEKSETTEEFTARLKTLGFTEAEIAARIDETGRSLRAQTDATQEASRVVSEFSAKVNTILNPSVNGFVASPGGPKAPSLQEFIGANAATIQRRFFGVMHDRPMRHSLGPFDVAGVASHLQSGAPGLGIAGVGGYVGGGAGSEQYARLANVLKALILEKLPSNQWDSVLRSFGVSGFAHGVEGIIQRPGLFMAGEHGAESISIRPLARGPANQGGSSVVLNIQPGAIVVQGDAAAGERIMDYLTREVKRLGVGGVS